MLKSRSCLLPRIQDQNLDQTRSSAVLGREYGALRRWVLGPQDQGAQLGQWLERWVRAAGNPARPAQLAGLNCGSHVQWPPQGALTSGLGLRRT